ncbi:MAG TPA: DUF1611 domain-containing protein, partial [Chromatiales bacterium]|nr:DUF1611 domain-containing protein [Chromatiales bacterium]
MQLIDLTSTMRSDMPQPDERRAATLPSERLARAKRSFVTRRVPDSAFRYLLWGTMRPKAGDLVLAKVLRLGQHTGIQRPDGRRAKLFPGDEIIIAYGARYAPNQFESELPTDLGPCHLVAAGGMASTAVSRHKRIKRATTIEPIGLLADENQRVLNLRDFRLPDIRVQRQLRAPVIAVAGTAMDAGKTTAVADLIRGLHRAGFRVGAAKVTGTGACGDYFHFVDAGADEVMDFTDAGYGSTLNIPVPELESV